VAFPPTEFGLPARLADRADTAAWERFVAIYRPAIVAVARQRGLALADADDVAQEVFAAVAGAVHRFDPDREAVVGSGPRARFSTWLATIADRKTIDALRRSRVRPASGHAFDAVASRDTDSRLLRFEVRRRLFLTAAADLQTAVSPTAWEAFWRTAIDGDSAERVAKTLGMTAGAVYAAKARTMRKLVERIRALESEWSIDPSTPSQLDGEAP
jgi:RNA polymerase sigma-70 factor (ECF subfamily)